MFEHMHLLSALIWLPVFGAIFVLLAENWWGEVAARVSASIIAFFMFACSLLLYFGFSIQTSAMQFVEHVNWIPYFQIDYHLGVDGISMPLVILSCFTTLLVVLGSWSTVKEKVGQYLAAFLVMQGMVVGVFAALDSILFYFFWEAMLIPMYLSIGIWGGVRRSYAAIKFFLYTFMGSALLLVAILYLHQQSDSFSILSFYRLSLSMHVQILIFLAFLLAFAVKVPMWPVHTWLPDAHTEAPAGGSVILAALMLKMGTYGFLRFSMPITPDASAHLAWLMIALSLIAIVYIGLIALAQTDMKRLIAYSSVAHMGFVTLGCFMVYLIIAKTGDYREAFMSIEGGMIQMITHAFGSGAMFLAFGLLYNQYKTRLIADFGGIANVMPIFAGFFVLFAMSNIGLPFTAGFVGEFLVILGAFKGNLLIALAAGSSVIIGAVYSLWMVRRVFFGPVANEKIAKLKDVRGLDLLVFFMLAIVILVVGVYPNPLLSVQHATVDHLLHIATQSHLPAKIV